ncbi:metal-dependent hydrolase-like protein [Parvibaculum lavamentivorans DS-1]|uniref:Metal-dependent hydrolase-like protein n=1 Tax=Parvibaculum lavamentivorans (strain DS-1 / DSM 13023 / NCIMB 13966) TaxID=402881 RepID=A7HP73_PARL1|nr:metal-dependent hydrolase [Parvibaculum lavamentivorans]ABS61706.1 metal-dependent hydrolase-like protein [Parvibaculum lavamentivorans DS-1]
MHNSTLSRTPENVEIVPRNRHFNIDETLATNWHSDDPFRTAFFDAMSILFPLGEQFFIDSVKAFRGQIDDPELQRRVRGFTAQEAVHRREHQHYNEALCRARGVSLELMERAVSRRQAFARRALSPMQQLSGTVAFEHLTAILADATFRNPEGLEGAHPEMKALWHWHALEETEHKSVAFDVFVAVGGKTWRRRVSMALVTVEFTTHVIRNMRLLLRDYEGSRLALWSGGMKFLFGERGALRGLMRPYLDFYKKDFHPWDHDNRELVSSVMDEFGGAAVNPV